MKTQIIQLEAYDDTVAVRDKMGWGQTSRVLLVWPNQGHPLDRRLDLVLLLRHSLTLGAQLGLVTQDGQVRTNALELGIPVFASLRQAQTSRWRVGRRRRPRLWRKGPRPDLRQSRPTHQPDPLNHPVVRIGLFSLSILALLTLAAVLLPGATITVQNPLATQQIILPVIANPDISTVNLSGDVPARWSSIIVEGRESITTTGTVLVPEKPATGNIQFTNLTEKVVQVPAGTVVSTLDTPIIRVATLKDGRVPAGVGRSATLAVQAVMPGTQGNLLAGRLKAIEGNLGLQLSANNNAAMRGGTSLPSLGPAERDRERLYSSLIKSLQQTAQDELLDRWQANPLSADFPIIATLEIERVLARIYQPEQPLPAKTLGLTLRLAFKVLVVAGSDLERLVTPVLDASLGADERPVAGTLTLRPTSRVELRQPNQAEWQLEARRKVQHLLTPAQAALQARGLPAIQARDILQQRLGLRSPAQVQVWPAWWPYLPFVPARIDVNFETQVEG